MSDPERSLISAAILAGDLKPIVTARIRPDDLEDEEHAKVLEWAYGHLRRHGTSPGIDALRLNHPTWKLEKVSDGIDVYIDALRDRWLYNLAQDGINDATKLLKDGNTKEALKVFQGVTTEALTDYAEVSDEDITLADSWTSRVEFYDDLRTNPGHLRGYSTGFRTIDVATRGVQRGQYIIIAGAQKAGKSTALQKIGITINEQGALVLSFNFEMDTEEVKARHDAMRAKVAYGRLLEGRATASDLKKIQRALERAEDGHPFIIVTDQENTTTVSGMIAKVEEHKPDVVLIDGIYLMDDDHGEPPMSDAALRNINNGIRRFCRKSGIPVIGTTQALESKTTKRAGITSYSVGYSSSFGQAASTLLGLQQMDDPPNSAELRVLESRSGPRAVSMVTWDWSTMTFEERHGEIGGNQSGETEDEAQSVKGSAPRF